MESYGKESDEEFGGLLDEFSLLMVAPPDDAALLPGDRAGAMGEGPGRTTDCSLQGVVNSYQAQARECSRRVQDVWMFRK